MDNIRKRIFFLLGCIGFLFGSWYFSLYMVLGAGFGAFGMYYVVRFFDVYLREQKNKKLIKLRIEVSKLEREVVG